MKKLHPGAVFLAVIGLAGQLAGQTPATATAVRRTGEIHIDGRIDEPAWRAASPITQFTQRTPNERAAPSQRTIVHILYDDDALYIGARMFDTQGVTTRLVRRDAELDSDALRINIDAYRDRLHYVEFVVNPSGVRGDALDGDASWDPVWETAASHDAEGWTAEMRIPFSQLHFSRDSVQTWGLQIRREIERLNEEDLWAFVPLNQSVLPAYYGVLEGLRFQNQPAHIELLPYASTRLQRLNSSDPASPFHDPNRVDVRVGGDVRYPVTPNLTLQATVNPDFGQVEVDPAVVNLSAFETFFSEKRPFFVEGASVFSFGNPGCTMNCGLGLYPFYTRRVGRSPQAASLAFAGADFVDIPTTTDILAAAKLTGRARTGTSIGIMDAVVGEERARVAIGDSITERVVHPFGNHFVARARHELRGGNLLVGGIVTSVDRDLSDDGVASLLPKTARVAGLDAELFWSNHTYRAYGAVIASDVAGDSTAILSLQRSSARYFQRPDRDLRDNGFFTSGFDPGLRRLRGFGAIARINKQSGDWRWDVNAATISPGFETNDLGFLQIADWNWVNASLMRLWTKPTSWYRSALVIVGADTEWNYDGDVSGRSATIYGSTTLLNYWTINGALQTAASPFDARHTRGGPVVQRPGNTLFATLDVSSDSRKRVYGGVGATYVTDVEGGYYQEISGSVTVRPQPNISLSAGPEYSRSFVSDQYVTTVADPTATNFFGRRYVFAHLHQTNVGMTLRGDVTVTPDLSLQVFAQPLIVSGDFSNFEEFERPRAMRKLIYGQDIGTITGIPGGYRIDPDAGGPAASFEVDNPNFNFRSLRGTAVLRWEWRPGSTMFLAWTQERSGAVGLGDFDFGRDRSALFRLQPDNVFVWKVTYWLSR